MIELLDSYDKELMLMLNYDGGTWLDHFWYVFSGKEIWIGFYLVTLFVLRYLCKPMNEKRGYGLLWLVLSVGIIILLCDQISSGLIKHLVERPRPSHCTDIEGMLHYVNGYRGGKFGFVSSHAANSIGLALWLCFLFRTPIFRTTVLLWSAMACYSRIYLGVHYPGDIIGGLCVGIIVATLIYWLYRRYVPHDQQLETQTREPWPITASIVATIFLASFAL